MRQSFLRAPSRLAILNLVQGPWGSSGVEAWDRALTVATGRLASVAFARRFGAFAGMTVASPDPLVAARTGLGAALDRLVDIDCPVEPLTDRHYQPLPLADTDGFARTKRA